MKTFSSFRQELNEVKLRDTLNFIKKAHAGQERSPGVPYWTHPADVARRLRKQFGSAANIDALTVALLHDVIEDTPHTAQDLLAMGYPEKVVNAVTLLTKNKKLSYGGNISNIVKSGNELAQMTKYADNQDNFEATPKVGASIEKIVKSKTKYARSMNILGQAISRRLGKPVKADYRYVPKAS